MSDSKKIRKFFVLSYGLEYTFEAHQFVIKEGILFFLDHDDDCTWVFNDWSSFQQIPVKTN